MLISPPFLPDQVDASWLDAAMSPATTGRFPVSHGFAWHGGRHLVAPTDSNRVGMLVRSIADGVVVYLRQRAEKVDSIDDPLNYGDGYTSDGVVVIKHTTDIGANAQGQPVEVTFYSVYMHLHSIRDTVQKDRRIYRKDPIGQAGHIYGQPNLLHFEICCDDANLARLVGRTSGDVSPLDDGRTDVLFGEVYFSLPAHSSVYGQRPLPNHLRASMQPPTPPATKAEPHPAAPPPEPLRPVHMTKKHLIVGVRYAGGHGEQAHRGDAVVSTYHLDGELEGTPLRESEAEYKLYQACTRISESYPTTGRPAPSAVYELLRFGRVIGPDPLTIDVPHWREVNYPGGTGWVNLNAVNISKFSDADFPQWRGWKLVDDDTGGDSHCDSATISRIVYDHGAQCLQPSRRHAFEQLDNPAVQKRLARTVCKFPSEWDASTIDQRWSWLMVATDEHPEPLTSEDYAELKAHITALSFPLPELFAAQWCFEPREFIELFRDCGWLSLFEFAQMLPRVSGLEPKQVPISWGLARHRLGPYAVDMNKVFRKYGFVSPVRRIHFLAQTYTETAMWRTVKEFGEGNQQKRKGTGELYWPAPAMEYYGYFFGRGCMQLTWADNYEKYGKYREFPSVTEGYGTGDSRLSASSVHYWSDPRDKEKGVLGKPRVWWPRYNPQKILETPFNVCDSGGYYWVSKSIGGGLKNIMRVADEGTGTKTVGRISVLVNGGGNGFFERQAFAAFIDRYMGDSKEMSPKLYISATHGRVSKNVQVDFTPQRP